MPYQDPASGCVFMADSYLTHTGQLAQRLGVSATLCDVELIALAYRQFGENFPAHLTGNFSIVIWDPNQNLVFLTVDHFGHFPCLYAFDPEQGLVFANTMQPFRILCQTLSLDETLFSEFSLDSMPAQATCYQEVKKVLPGHLFAFSPKTLRKKQYWTLENSPPLKRHFSRQAYHEEFRTLFASAVETCLPSQGLVSAQISGGLDSSSVTAMAAHLLQKKGQKLHAFTAIPNGLSGPSYKKNWYYHEMPRVQKVLDQYPNIEHQAYLSNPETDPYQLLSQFYPYTDQPYRNISNFDWIVGHLEEAHQRGIKVLLTGGFGNATISWTGMTLRSHLGRLRAAAKTYLKPSSLFSGYYGRHNPDFLQKNSSKSLLRKRGIILNPKYWMQNSPAAPRYSSIRPIYFWYGIENLDPTQDIELLKFCYRLPEFAYRKLGPHFGKNPRTLTQRLLVRDGLTGIVPPEIRFNPYRGEQAADWYLHWNIHATAWQQQLRHSTPQSQALLARLYDTAKMNSLFLEHAQIGGPEKESVLQVQCNLLRYLSLAFFVNFLSSS